MAELKSRFLNPEQGKIRARKQSALMRQNMHKVDALKKKIKKKVKPKIKARKKPAKRKVVKKRGK